MVSRYRVWLNDYALADIDPRIYISDIGYTAPAVSLTTSKLARRDGEHVSGGMTLGTGKVTVSFAIRAYGQADRQAILQGVAAWAAVGGWLKTSDRPGQQIYVRCSAFPSISSVMKWTDSASVEFTAYDYPFWQDITPNTVLVEQGDTASLYCRGVHQAHVEASIIADAALSSVALTCGATSIALTGLSIPAQGQITVSYTDDRHLLEIKTGTTSLLDKRTASSSDDLIALPGNNSVGFTASALAFCTLAVKGVWL